MEPWATTLAVMLAGKIIDEIFAKNKKFEKYKGLLSWAAMIPRLFIKKRRIR